MTASAPTTTAASSDRPDARTADSPEARIELGRSIRKRVPRSSLARWEPAPDRRDPVDVLEAEAATREPALVPLRYGRMLASSFAFYRGGAGLMAADLATVPHTGLMVQLCGDAHLANFGVYAAPDRRLVFSLNDFDETIRGPFEWDVARLAASFEIAGRHRSVSPSRRARIVASAVRRYRRAVREFAAMSPLEVWYQRLDVEEIPDRFGENATALERKRFARAVRKARSKTSLRAAAKLTEVVDGEPRFRSDPPTLVPIEELVPPGEVGEIPERVAAVLSSYRSTLAPERRLLLDRYRYAHLARKVVGVGSVGTRAWAVLLVGRDGTDPLLLQFKEAQESALEPFLGPSGHVTHGERIVEGQRLMQSASDIFLGWHRGVGLDGIERDFFVRQLWDEKGSADLETIDAGSLEIYAALCGWTLALAHARSGDAAAIGGYLGGSDRFDRCMVAFAARYADQNERDHQALRRGVDDGRVAAVDA